jgi:hypothetical protein
MLWNLGYAPDFNGVHEAAGLTSRTSLATVPLSRSDGVPLRTIYDALREGLAAYRQYERLRSRRIPHDMAIRAALGIDRSHVHGRRHTPKALCVASRA